MKRYAHRIPLGQITPRGSEISRKRDEDMKAAFAKFNEGLRAHGIPIELTAEFFDNGNQLGIAVNWDA